MDSVHLSNLRVVNSLLNILKPGLSVENLLEMTFDPFSFINLLEKSL